MSNKPNLVDLSKVSSSRNLPMQTVGPEVGKSQYDYNVTPNNLDYLQEQRAARQSALDKLGNGITNMAFSAFTGAAESTVGFVYGVSSAIVNQDASKLWKNGFTDNFIDPMNNWVKENNPFYYSQKEQEASLLGSMGYQNFWFDKVLGGAGYTVGSLAAGYGLSGLFGLTKGSAVAGKALSETITSAEALKSVELAGKLQGRIDMGKQFMMGGIMAHGESAMEARQTYEEALKNGMTPQQAMDAANTNYIMNLAITGPTDMMLLGKWINPGAKEAIKDYNKITRVLSETGEVTLKDATLDNARRGYVNAGKKFLQGFATEGSQEGFQFASNIGAQKFVQNYQIEDKNWLTSIVSGLAEGIEETLTTKEGLESILVGGITGGPFNMKGARSERLAREAATQQRINSLTKDPDFLQGGSKMANYILANNALQKAEVAKQNKDLYEAKNQEAYAFGKYVQSHIDGNTTDLLIEKLNTLKQAPVEEFNQFFGFKPGDTNSQTETIDKLTGRIQKMQNLHDNITRAYGLAQGTPTQIAENKWLRNALFEASFTIENKEERENKMAEELNNLTRNPALEIARRTLINSYKNRDFETAEKMAKEWEKLTEKSLKGEGKVNVGVSYEDFRKTQRETYRQEYNALVEKTLDENPTIADDITSLLADLNKNAEERETLIKYLNGLRNPESRKQIKPMIEKGMLKQLTDAIKEANANAPAPSTPVTTEEESAAIFPTGLENKEKFVQTPGGEQVNVGEMTNEQVGASIEAVIQEMNNLDPASPEFKAKQAYAVQLEEELNLRTNGDAILKNLRARYMAATTLEEKKRIIEEAASKGFKINLDKYEEDVKKHEAKNQAPAAKQQVNGIDDFFSNLFKGTGEFQDVVIYSKGEEGVIAREAFENLKNDPDFKDKITVEVQKDVTPAGPIPYGNTETTQHPTLGKQRSNFNIIVKYAGTPIGFITFYDTFVNKQTGKTVDILNMGLDEFKQIFNKNATAADLSAFQNAYKNAMMFHNYVTSDEILQGKNYATVPVGKLREFINPYLTSGSISKVQENEDFVPLSNFTLYENSKGEPTIVDTRDPYISSLNDAEGSPTTYNTTNSEAYESKLNEDGTFGKPSVNPELENAFIELSKLKKEKKAYSRYWALVQDSGGNIKIGDKNYRWTALTPSGPYAETEALMKGLNEALSNDPGSPEARKEVKKQLNKGLFIVFGDNGNYASNFSVGIQPDYGFTTKDGKKIPEGYTLQIFSPTFFRNKATSGETNGIKWSIKNGDTLYLKFTGRTESFERLVSGFEAVRLALSSEGGPLVGTTVITENSFKSNPDIRIDKIAKDQLPTIFSSTTKVKRENQKLAFGFNEKALIDATPGGAPQPKAPAPKQTASQPDINQQKADIEKRRKYSFSKELGVTKGVDDKIGGLYVSENNQERITGNSIQEVTDKINAKYDAELLKVLEAELEAGKMMFDFTPAEQAIIKQASKQSAAPTTNQPLSPDEIQRQNMLNMLGATPAPPAAPANQNLSPDELQRLAMLSMLGAPAPQESSVGEQLANIIAAGNAEMEGASQQPGDAANQAMGGSTTDAKANPAQPAPQGTPAPQSAPSTLRNVNTTDLKVGTQLVNRNNPTYIGIITSIASDGTIFISTDKVDSDFEDIDVLNKDWGIVDNTTPTQPTPTQPTSTKPDFDQKPPSNLPVFSRTDEDTTLSPQEQINITEAFAELRKMLPDWIDAQELDILEANIHKGITTLGYFQNNIIKLSLLATVGTQYHEAFHAVFRTMLTTQEQSVQYEIAKQELRAQLKQKGISYNTHRAEYLRLTPEARNLAEPVIELLILEEYMADKFKDYMNKQKTTSKLRKYFDKILRMLGLMKTSEMDKLFAKIENGGFKKATKVTSRFDSPMFKGAPANNSIFLRNNSATNAPVYLNNALQLNEVNKITGMVLSIIDNQNANPENKDEDLSAFDNDAVDAMIDKILNYYAKDFFSFNSETHLQLQANGNLNALKKYEDLMYLYNNAESRRLFKEEIFKSLNKFNIDETSDYSIEDSEISDSSSERNYDKNQEQVGGFGSLSKFMRRYIATTTYTVSFNEFFGTNIPEFENSKMTVSVNPTKIYNALTKACQNQADINNVLHILADQLQNNGEAMHFIAKFFKDSGVIQDPVTGLADLSGLSSNQDALVQKVAKAFNLWSLNYKFGSFDPNGKLAEVIDSNRRDVDKMQVNNWSQNFTGADPKQAANQIQGVLGLLQKSRVDVNKQPIGITEVELLQEAKVIQNALKVAGMELSLGYIKHLILSNPNLVVKTDRQINKVNLYETSLTFSEAIRNLEFIKDEINKSTATKLVNPYERVIGADKKERGAVTRAEEIAKDNAIFDESVEPSSFVNAEGKTIYGLQTDTYHIRKMFEIATSEDWDLETLKLKAEQDPTLIYLLSNPLLNSENFNAIKRTLKVERIDGLRERSISYDQESKENKIGINKRQTEGVTYGSLGAREYAMLPYMLYTTKDVQYINEKPVSFKPVLITVMEASNTADTVSLPVVQSVNPETGKITNTFIDAIFNQLEGEHNRIKAFEQGKFTQNRILNFNYGKKQRAGEFWADNRVILEAVYGTGPEAEAKIDEITKADNLEPYKEDIKKGIEAWVSQEIDNHIEDLIELGILKRSPEGNLENILLPKGFSELLADGDPNKIFVGKADLKNNISQVYLSNMVNTFSINQLLSGDPALSLKDYTDKFKRDRGANASGANTSRVTLPNRPATKLKYGVYITPEFDEIKSGAYALGPTKIVQIYKPGTTEFTDEFKELEQELTPDQLAQAKKDGQIAVADAQGFGTVALFREIYDSLGRMTPELHKIFDKIEEGKEINQFEQKKLADNQVMLNSLKMVYYNGQEYLKLSIAPLTKQGASIKNKNGKWVAQKGLEWHHDMREKMEGSGLHLLGPTSMSKKLTMNPIMLDKDGNLPNVEAMQAGANFLDSNYFRLQQENPSNKIIIKDPTQMLQILAAEQNPNTDVTLPDGRTLKVGEILNKYNELLGYRIEDAAKIAKAFITELKGEISKGKPTIKLNKLIQIFREVAAQSGASEKLLSVLELDQNGDPLYDINLPDVVTKFEEMFNAHFNKVFSQKIPGYKLTLQSGHGHNIIYNKATGKIVNRVQYLANPEAYEGEEYGTRELAYDQPRMVNGKEVGRYSEIIIPYHFAEQFGLKPGDEIPEEIAYLFGVRIPSQDKHSAMALKIVDILPPYYGSNAIFPKELILLTGSDFDIDSFYVHRPAHYIKKAADGTPKFMLFGNKEDSAFEQHVLWYSKSDVFVKSNVSIIKKSNSPLATAYKAAREALNNKKAELAEVYKYNKTISDALKNSNVSGTSFESILTKKELEANKKEIEAIQKELDVLKENLVVADLAIALQAMRELRIPTTEEEFKKTNPRNPGADNNELLEMKIALHTNSHINKEIAKTPATLRAVQEEALPKLLELLGYNPKGDNYGRKTTTYSITGLLKAFVANKAGSAAIGAAVNATQLYSIFSRYGLTKIQPIIFRGGKAARKPYIQIDGITLDGISKTSFLNKPGNDGKSAVRRIMDVLSTLTSSMTDNGKWLFNSKMNIDLDTLSVVSYGVQQGMPLTHMIYMINNEYVNRFIKLGKTNAIQTLVDGKSEDERNAEARKALFVELEEKITREDPNVDLQGLALEPISYKELTVFIKYSSLGKAYLNSKDKANFYAILEQSPEGEAFLKAQYKLLNAYSTLQKEAMFVNTFNNLVKLTKGVVGAENDRSFSADDTILEALNTLNVAYSKGEDGKYYFTHLNPKDATNGKLPFDVVSIIQNDPLIRANLTEFLEKQEISKEIFVAKTELAQKTRNIVGGSMNKFAKTIVKRKTLRAFRRNFESYFNTIAFRQWWNANRPTKFPRLDSMLFKDLDKTQASLQDQITKFITDNPQFKGNLFFRLLRGDTNEKTSFENLTTNTRAKNNPGFLSDVLNDFDNILNHNEEGYNLANNLFIYQIARYGLQYKNDSFVGIIATNRFRVIANNIKEMIPLFNNLSEQKFQDKFGMSKNEALHGFMKRFFSDINNSNAVRTIYSKPIEKYSYIDPSTGALVFPRASQLISRETLPGGQEKVEVLTKEQTDKRRNARHDYIGAVERPDGNRSTAFPYALKLKSKGVTTLYMLQSLNGVPITDVKLLEAAFKDNNGGALDGHSATYVPVNYTGSNISNNAFLPYSLTDEELENVTAHIQATVGKNAVENTTTPAVNIDEYDDAEINAIGSTDVVDGLGGLAGLGLGAYADQAFTPPTQSSNNVEVVGRYTDADVKANPNKIYVFGDNVQRVGTGGQAQIRNNPNAMGIATKLAPSMADSAFMSDRDLATNKAIIDSDIAKIKATGKTVVFPKDGLGTGLAKLQEKAPQTYEYLTQKLLQEFGFNNDTGALQGTSSKALENVKPNVAINVNANPAEKSVMNIAELKSLLLQDAMFSYSDATKNDRMAAIYQMTDEQLVEEALKKNLKC
jgi:hypothetical protein